MSLQGGYFYSLGALMLFMVLLQELTREKENRLRQGLNVVGVSHGAYWLSWFIIATMINVLQTAVFILSGFIWGFQMWWHCPLDMLFYFHFVYTECMILVAFMVSTSITKQETANQISYTIILT